MSDMSKLTGTEPIKEPKIPHDLNRPLQQIKDLFYNSKKTLWELFRMVLEKDGKTIDRDGFVMLCLELSNNAFPPYEAVYVFK